MCLKDDLAKPQSDCADAEAGAGEQSTPAAEGTEATPGYATEQPHQAQPESESGFYALVIRDVSSGASIGGKQVLNCPLKWPLSCLFTSIAKYFKYDPTSFALVWQSRSGDEVDLHNFPQDQELSTLWFEQGPDCHNNLMLCDLNGLSPRKVDEDDLTLGASASPTIPYCNHIPWYDAAESGQEASSVDASKKEKAEKDDEWKLTSPKPSLETPVNFVGLVNQAMTCYLNSLLQTLFMTPEFRNALYRWEFTGTEEDALKSIPFQLQKLFLQLQTTSRSAVETTNLTRSFGWDSNEAWQQHDIQELCRVMFDALEQCFKNTDQADLINNLYEGKMKDYVKCLECGTENAREDTFLDIPLPIRPFGSNAAYKSVEEALRAFVEPELLTGNNKYECSKCSSLCDAHKGLKFAKFPYLLTIHLKRFDFDYQTFHRIKLNDEVTFPNHLDLNSFIEGSPAKEDSPKIVQCQASTPDKLSADKVDDASITDSGSAFDTEESNSVELTSTQSQTDIDTQDEDEGIDVSSIYNEKNKQGLPSGPRIYDLFSIMIHSGSASGGHYYAYIKDFKTNEWFCFNDQSVSKITYDDIRKTYGGSNSRGYYWSSSANAYMLMYRQVDKERNVQYFSKEELPVHIVNLVQKMVNEEEAEREAREIERSMIKLRVFYPDPKLKVSVIYKLRLLKDTTLREATKLAYEEFNLESEGIPLERCRLVKYEDVHESIECSFENQDDEPLSEIIGGFRAAYKFDLLMEVREEGKEFEEYKPGGTTVKVYTINLANQEVEGPTTVRVSQNLRVRQFKELLGRSLSMDADKMRIVTEKYSGDFKPLSPDSANLKAEGFYRSMKIYVEASGQEPVDYFPGSLMYGVLDRYEHTITLTCQMPHVTKGILEELQIPPLAEEDLEPPSVGVCEEAAETPIQNSTPAVPGSELPPQEPLVSSAAASPRPASSCDAGIASAASLSTATSITTSVMGSAVASSVALSSSPSPSPFDLPPNSSAFSYPQGPSFSSPVAGGSQRPTPPPPPGTLALSPSPSSGTCVSTAPSSLPPAPPSSADLCSKVSTNSTSSATPVLSSGAVPPPPAPPSSSTSVSSAGQASGTTCPVISSLSARLSSSGNLSDGEDEGIVDMDGATGSSSSAVNSDQSASEDSSLTSDSDRTLVGDPPEDKLSNTSDSPDYHNVSSPEENKEKGYMEDVWGLPPHISDEWNYDTKEETKHYFKAHLPIEVKDNIPVLSISVDKRITIGQFKKELQRYIGVSHEHFKLFKIYTNSTQEFECTRMSETLTCYVESSILKVQLSRALLPGEHKCKIYMLDLKATEEPAIFLADFVIRYGDVVSKVKEAIVKEVNAKNMMDLEPQLVRIRKKSWKNPLTIYQDHHVFGMHISLYSNFELYLQVLTEPDFINKDEDELAIFAKRWRPSSYSTDPLVEVVLRKHTTDELKQQLSKVSGIPPEEIAFAKGKGAFPCEMSVLDIAADLDWTQRSGSLDQKSFFIQDDGSVVYYKDKFEKTKKLTESERSEWNTSENARLNRAITFVASPASTSSPPNNYSRRSKEKGLRIYLPQNP